MLHADHLLTLRLTPGPTNFPPLQEVPPGGYAACAVDVLPLPMPRQLQCMDVHSDACMRRLHAAHNVRYVAGLAFSHPSPSHLFFVTLRSGKSDLCAPLDAHLLHSVGPALLAGRGSRGQQVGMCHPESFGTLKLQPKQKGLGPVNTSKLRLMCA